MAEKGINEKIISGIRKFSRDKEEIAKFIIELLNEESNHTSQWWWKDFYKKKILNFLENKKFEENED